MAAKIKLSKTSQKLVDSFEESAKQYGWQQDCGTGSSVDKAEASFKEDKEALEKRILKLESDARRLKGQQNNFGRKQNGLW
jgi:hypothetical protein